MNRRQPADQGKQKPQADNSQRDHEGDAHDPKGVEVLLDQYLRAGGWSRGRSKPERRIVVIDPNERPEKSEEANHEKHEGKNRPEQPLAFLFPSKLMFGNIHAWGCNEPTTSCQAHRECRSRQRSMEAPVLVTFHTGPPASKGGVFSPLTPVGRLLSVRKSGRTGDPVGALE